MSTTLTIDPAGGLFLPPELLAQAHLPQGATVEVDVAVDQIVVKPASPECLC
jgi:antitoxin component of MazEF toxin-antitoxin module